MCAHDSDPPHMSGATRRLVLRELAPLDTPMDSAVLPVIQPPRVVVGTIRAGVNGAESIHRASPPTRNAEWKDGSPSDCART